MHKRISRFRNRENSSEGSFCKECDGESNCRRSLGRDCFLYHSRHRKVSEQVNTALFVERVTAGVVSSLLIYFIVKQISSGTAQARFLKIALEVAAE